MPTLKKYISPILLLLAAIIWGFAFSAQKAAENVPPFTIGAVRSIFACFFLLSVIAISDKISKNGRRLFSKEKKLDFRRTEIIGGIICGAVLATASFFQQYGINGGTDAGKASFITALYVVLVPVYALVLKKKAPINVWISMPFAVIGFYLLCIKGGFTADLSDIFVLISALIFPIHILSIDRFSVSSDGIRMSCVQFFTASVLNSVLALIFESPIDFFAVLESIFPLLFLGIGSSGIAYTLQIVGQKGANPAAASLILSLESVFGVVGSALFLKESMSLREYAGSAIVFLAVVFSQFDLSKSRKNIDLNTKA